MKDDPIDRKREGKIINIPANRISNTFTHQFRTPLTAITGYISLLRDGAFGNLSIEQLDVVGIISRNLRRVNILLDDLKDLNNIDSGNIVFGKSLISIEELLKPLVRDFAILADEKDLEFTVMTGEGIKIFVDVEAIRRALLHIVHNAINYTPVGKVMIKATRDGSECVIEVVDTGVGIDNEDMQHLFTKYFRSAKSYIRESPGAGLGLYIAKSLVESNAGSVNIDSEPGSGTTVTIRLPLTLSS